MELSQPEPPRGESPRDNLPGLKPPQFRLRTLMGIIAVLAVLLAVARRTEPIVWGLGLFAVVSVLAHIAGNALGTQLRRRNGARFRGGEDSAPAIAVHRPPPSPPSHLHLRASLGWTVPILTIVGGVLGAAAGCWWIRRRYGPAAEVAAFVTAIAGFGGLGAFLTFIAGGFFQVIGQAIYQADTTGDPRGKR